MKSTVIGLSACLLIGQAAAQSYRPTIEGEAYPTPGGKPPVAFAALDLDANGKIDRTEAKADALLGQNFEVLDVDGDGNLDQSEFAASTNVVGHASF